MKLMKYMFRGPSHIINMPMYMLRKGAMYNTILMNIYKIVFIQVRWYYLIFFNGSHCLVIGIFYVSHNITNFGDFFSWRFLLGGNKRTWWEWQFIQFNGCIIVIVHEYNFCSNSKWKIVPNLSSQNLKMFTNLLWVVIWHHSNI
jgi:hypothetical protein